MVVFTRKFSFGCNDVKDMLVFVLDIASVLSPQTLRECLLCTVFILKPQPRC